MLSQLLPENLYILLINLLQGCYMTLQIHRDQFRLVAAQQLIQLGALRFCECVIGVAEYPHLEDLGKLLGQLQAPIRRQVMQSEDLDEGMVGIGYGY